MSLSLKDPETDYLARKLSSLTGESITQAITIALRERLERYEHSSRVINRLRVIELVDQFQKELPVGASSYLDTFFYDEQGLPI
jgi:antitoxin VapB